jgi:hypothetical protein
MLHRKTLACSASVPVLVLVAWTLGSLLTCPLAAEAQDTSGRVTQFSRMVVQRSCFTATVLQNGQVLVTGGIVDAVGDATASAEL